MKKAVVFGVLSCMFGCSVDAFDASDSGMPLQEPAHRALLLHDDDAGDAGVSPDASPDVESGGKVDAGCSLAADPSPYCAGACATADGGLTCGNTTNGACVNAEGFYAECSKASDCGFQKICALANVDTMTGACPPNLATAGHGVTISCADPSYLSIVKTARPLCTGASDCVPFGFAACVGAAIAGYPALAGEAVGVCE